MSDRAPVRDLRGALDRVAERGCAVLRRRRIAEAWSAGFTRCLPWAAGVPAAFAVYALARRVGLLDGPAAPLGLVAGVTLLAVVLRWLQAPADALSADLDPVDGLAVVDRELDLQDRLQTAHGFLVRRERGPFVLAALDDARAAAARALDADLPRPRVVWTAPPSPARWPLVGLVLLLLGAWIDPGALPMEADAGVVDVARNDPVARPDPAVSEPEPDAVKPPERPPAPRRDATKKGQEETQPDKASSSLPEQSKDTRGTTGSGESSPAADSTGASQSKGMPSGQGQSSDPGDRKPKKKPKPKKLSKKPDAEDDATGKPRPQEKSGATAGTGTASGSNKNPAASEWASKDQVTDTEDDPVENDEDVDDEDSDSEARGGVQPTLRDRKPPANRDLQIGFGNRPNPDANGRGGPSQMKKSRGTASLVLGVPIPDHVKGQANPGRTKITQERVDPKEDEAAPVTAGDRGPRAGSPGEVPTRRLAPWMRALVRAYFLSLHAEPEDSP